MKGLLQPGGINMDSEMIRALLSGRLKKKKGPDKAAVARKERKRQRNHRRKFN